MFIYAPVTSSYFYFLFSFCLNTTSSFCPACISLPSMSVCIRDIRVQAVFCHTPRQLLLDVFGVPAVCHFLSHSYTPHPYCLLVVPSVFKSVFVISLFAPVSFPSLHRHKILITRRVFVLEYRAKIFKIVSLFLYVWTVCNVK